MTPDQVSTWAQQLDGVRESTRDGLRRWEVHGRMVARQVDDETLVIRSDFDARERLLAAHPETFSVSPRYESHQTVVADLRGERAAIERAISSAWELQTSHR